MAIASTEQFQSPIPLKDYSGGLTASIYNPRTKAEMLSHLATGWGANAITKLELKISEDQL